ncbi:signal-transduction protein [Desulfonema ishimotonii]|uniref:Signal-transduction protein n=1 Tax=Desulfonema ishimotonii TaxID=45657 RepID=A0A401FQP3_9BACT|nr:CBS and ACT domain-containing protein [Desulfonema ishimotonii]GBC59282.1 signal-transduction protein [Desulfonema ishimotonii]
MKVKALMVSPPITITTDASIEEAIRLMKTSAIRHLPVVSGDNTLEGLLTLADLKEGLLPSMVSDISLADLVIPDPVTVGPEDDIETAARRIYYHKISGIPVVTGEKLVGILTETDILRTFIDMMGILTSSSHIEIVIGDDPEAFKQAVQIIQETEGDILNVTMTAQEIGQRVYYFRLFPCDTAPIRTALEAGGFRVLSTTDES